MNLPENRTKSQLKIPGNAWLCFLLVLSILAIYWQVLGFEFVNYDDDRYVTRNPMVQQGLTWESVKWAFSSTHAEFWHPLTWLSHMLDTQLFGLNPAGHHFSNLLLHIINTLLLFWIFATATGHQWRSYMVAALFALHPLHVESVAWVAERKDVLSTFFWMLTTLMYVGYAKNPGMRRYMQVSICLILGLMTKPMLVTLPFVFLLLDLWPLKRLNLPLPVKIDHKSVWQQACLLIREKIPLFTITAVFSIITFIAQTADRHAGSFGHPLDERLATSLVSYIIYLIKTVWPFQLAVFYPYPDRYSFWQVAGAFLILAIITFGVIRAVQRCPYLPVGWFWYMGTFLPVIGIVQVGAHATADRYTYIPLIGIFIMIAWGFHHLLAGWRHQKLVVCIGAPLIVGFFMAVAFTQIGHWQNSSLLFENALKNTRDNYLAYNNLGNIFFRKGQIEIAKNYYTSAIQIEPEFAVAHGNLGATLVRKGKIRQAIDQFNLALSIDPGQKGARQNLGNTLAAVESIRAEIATTKKIAETDSENHQLKYELGTLYQSLGETKNAIQQYERIPTTHPQFVPAVKQLAGIQKEIGNYREAIGLYQKVLKIEPQSADIPYKIAILHADYNNIDESVFWFKKALKKGFNNWELVRSNRNMNPVVQIIVSKQ
jgi:tetratricopeptide (TPR) repeat protein